MYDSPEVFEQNATDNLHEYARSAAPRTATGYAVDMKAACECGRDGCPVAELLAHPDIARAAMIGYRMPDEFDGTPIIIAAVTTGAFIIEVDRYID